MKKVYLFLSLVFVSCFSFSIQANAQLTIVPTTLAATLAAKLTGPGVTVMAPTLTCSAGASATFSGVSTLSFDSGIILCSGTAVNAGGPSSFFASTGWGSPGVPQLTALAGQPTNDACILQFDFRPAGDTIKFDYQFGSEEYNGYTCSSFNDVFGFFISGPGFGAPTNIALIPGTTIPVCINSVNCSALPLCVALVGPGTPYCSYYINNIGGSTITYDGLTTTLTAIAGVTPCDTYHLKIGIADGTDDILDSGVFLKAGSLTSTGIHIAPLGINPADTGFGAQYCVRGCIPGRFVFSRTGATTNPFTIHYIIAGTAVNGYDYTTIADSIVIPIGSSSGTVFINGLVVPPAGPKTVKLLILAPYTCGGASVIIDSAQLTIYDSFYVHINTADTAICLGDSVHFNTSGDTILHYSWAPTATLNNPLILNPTAYPTVTTIYTVSAVFPGAGCTPSTDVVKVTVYVRPTLDAGADTQRTCLGIPLQLNVTATPSGIPYTYSWTPATYLDNATIASPKVTPGVAGDVEYHVVVTAPVAGCNTTDSFLLHVLPNDFTLTNQDTGICFPPSTYQIFIAGTTEFAYQWSPTTGVSVPNTMNPTISPSTTTTYTVTATYPACPNMVHSVLFSIEDPRVNIITTDTTICIGEPIVIPIVVTPADSPFTFSWSSPSGSLAGLTDPTVMNTTFFSPTPGSYTYVLTIQSGLGCTSSDMVTFHPAPPIHIGVTPAVSTIKYGEHVQLDAVNYSPYPLYYYWTPNNGTLDNNNINNPVATPVDSVTRYTVYAMNEWGCGDTARAVVYVDADMDECIPTAFTPNGDHHNDVFRLCDMTYRKLVDFRVFNRWGQQVYQNISGDVKNGWDGTFNGEPQDMGVYSYMFIIAKPDGTQKVYKGDVTLVR